MTEKCFQRARTQEQREQRREDVLAVTEALVAERGVAHVSLNEIARAVGLAKSNVLRYFESREQIMLTLLARHYKAWVDDLVRELPTVATDTPEAEVATVVARTIWAHPQLCDLLTAMPTVLEDNLSAEVALAHRSAMKEQAQRIFRATTPLLGELDTDRQRGLIVATHAFVVMVWSASRPSPGMAEALRTNPELKTIHITPESSLREFLTTFLVGLKHRPPRFPPRLPGDADATGSGCPG